MSKKRMSYPEGTLEYYIANHEAAKVHKWLKKNAKVLDEKLVKTSKGGKIPLHLACLLGFTELARCILEASTSFDGLEDEMVQFKDEKGFTSLHLAAHGGKNDTCELLLKHGSKVNAASHFGWTPLHRACWAGKTDTALLLISFGADVDLMDHSGETALHIAAFYGKTETAVALVTVGGADINSPAGNIRKTPIHLAIKNKRIKTAFALLDCPGANVNAKSSFLETPLHEAARYSVDDAIPILVSKYGADVDAKDSDGNTPLQVAETRKLEETVKILEKVMYGDEGRPPEAKDEREDTIRDLPPRTASKKTSRKSSSLSRLLANANFFRSCFKVEEVDVVEPQPADSEVMILPSAA